jgi:hypothetical protein
MCDPFTASPPSYGDAVPRARRPPTLGAVAFSERLGHATVSITLDTYSRAIPTMQEEEATLIAGLVFA